MKVELSKDPLFDKKQSPVKELKEKQAEKQKLARILRMNPVIAKIQPDIEVIDPLPQEISKYKDQTQIPKTFQNSRASTNLRRYLIEQQKNLKCLRLQRIQSDQMRSSTEVFKEKTSESRYFNNGISSQFDANPETNQNRLDYSFTSGNTLNKSRSRNAGMQFNFLEKQLIKQNGAQESKPIDIPKIQKLFENQQKEFVLYESKLLKNSLEKAMVSLNKSVNQIEEMKYTGIRSQSESLNNTCNSVKHGILPPINISQHNSVVNQEDLQIDDRIEKKLKKSQRLRQKMDKQKKELQNHHFHNKNQSSEPKSLSFFLQIPKKPKKQYVLKGNRSIAYKDGEKILEIMPASSLLFELNKLGKGKLKKQKELSGLLTNSYKNREDILEEKSSFYEEQTPFSDLSASNQFKLRKQMDRRLVHRLQLSKEQVNKFTAYLYEIKEYHVILGDIILEVLKDVREELMSGKVMKAGDLTQILNKIKNKYGPKCLNGYPNEKIVHKLYDMMI